MDQCHMCIMSMSKMQLLQCKMPNSAPYPNYRWFVDLSWKMHVRAWSWVQYTGIVLDYYSNLKNRVMLKLKSKFKKEYCRVKRKLKGVHS
eukprot:1098294-Rhodomonas_salina.2